jgi:hypothetical protein
MSNFVIEKGQINNIALTLSERSRLTSPYYLFVFKSKFSVCDTYAYCSLQAVSNMRYDLLQIEEKTSPIPLNGEVFLISGEWSYEVYESQAQTLEVAETTERVIQRGFIIVKD